MIYEIFPQNSYPTSEFFFHKRTGCAWDMTCSLLRMEETASIKIAVEFHDWIFIKWPQWKQQQQFWCPSCSRSKSKKPWNLQYISMMQHKLVKNQNSEVRFSFIYSCGAKTFKIITQITFSNFLWIKTNMYKWGCLFISIYYLCLLILLCLLQSKTRLFHKDQPLINHLQLSLILLCFRLICSTIIVSELKK